MKVSAIPNLQPARIARPDTPLAIPSRESLQKNDPFQKSLSRAQTLKPTTHTPAKPRNSGNQSVRRAADQRAARSRKTEPRDNSPSASSRAKTGKPREASTGSDTQAEVEIRKTETGRGDGSSEKSNREGDAEAVVSQVAPNTATEGQPPVVQSGESSVEGIDDQAAVITDLPIEAEVFPIDGAIEELGDLFSGEADPASAGEEIDGQGTDTGGGQPLLDASATAEEGSPQVLQEHRAAAAELLAALGASVAEAGEGNQADVDAEVSPQAIAHGAAGEGEGEGEESGEVLEGVAQASLNQVGESKFVMPKPGADEPVHPRGHSISRADTERLTVDATQGSDGTAGDDSADDDPTGSHASKQETPAKPVLGDALHASSEPRVSGDRPVLNTGPSLAAPHMVVDAAAPTGPKDHQPAAIQQPLAPSLDASQFEANVSRVIRGMHGTVNQQGGAVTLRLSPPEMGIVRIEMQIDGGVVTARLHAEHESAKTLLTQRLHELRQSLEMQGLTVDRLHVQTLGQDKDAGANSGRQDADPSGQDGRSRGRFAGGDEGGQPDGQQRRREDDRSDQRVASFERVFNTVA